jgi:glycosyltransferase involved in cell wall biosynthesis
MNLNDVSVVIPAFNSERYIDDTLDALAVAAKSAQLILKVVVVDDGSTDATVERIERNIRPELVVEIEKTTNNGAFLARWAGVNATKTVWVLFLDSRQLISEDFFAEFIKLLGEHPEVDAWISHTVTDPAAPLVGHFWSVPTAVFWGGYWQNPKHTKVIPENFDSVPKGTGGLLVRRGHFIDACEAIWPEGNQKFISDDTKLLRLLCSERVVALDPRLASIYRPRGTVKLFLKHAFNRGTLFIDSYMSTSKIRFAILLLVVLVPIVLFLIGLISPQSSIWLFAGLFSLFVVMVMALLVRANQNNANPKALRSFLIWALPFAVVFWAGLVRGILVHWKSIRPKSGKL